MHALKFFSEFLAHPVSVGAVAETSRTVARVVAEKAEVSRAGFVVEYGPGTGSVTRVLLDAKAPDAGYMAIEVNPSFVPVLRERFPSAVIVEGSAADVRKFLHEHSVDSCDAIICGLPLAAFGDPLQTQIINESYNALTPGGRFVAFSYFHAPYLERGRLVAERLRATFDSFEKTPLIWRNFPPAFAYVCRK